MKFQYTKKKRVMMSDGAFLCKECVEQNHALIELESIDNEVLNIRSRLLSSWAAVGYCGDPIPCMIGGRSVTLKINNPPRGEVCAHCNGKCI